MTESIFEHSEEWFEKLTLTTNELSFDELNAIKAHVASCSICYRFIAENATLERFIDALPAPDFPPGLSPRLLQLWEEEDRNSKLEQMLQNSYVAPTRNPDGKITLQVSRDGRIIETRSINPEELLGRGEEDTRKPKDKPL